MDVSKMDFLLIRSLTTFLLLILFSFFLITTVNSHPNFKSLEEYNVIDCIKQKDFPLIDVVILPPSLHEDEKNLSVESIFRFAPWVNRIHLYSTNDSEEEKVDLWGDRNSRVVVFKQDILNYTLVSPSLQEHFIFLRPGYMFTNYVFPWQFFIKESPVLMPYYTGCIPLSRGMFNENLYAGDMHYTPLERVEYAVEKAIEDKRILYRNNRDHFSTSFDVSRVSSSKKISSVSDALRMVEPLRKCDKVPSFQNKFVLCVICDPSDDLNYPLQQEYDGRNVVWVKLTHMSQPERRLSFIHRMVAGKNLFIEIATSKFDYDVEKVTVEIMRRLKELKGRNSFLVDKVFSYPPTGSPKTIFTNKVSNKVASVYEAGFRMFYSETLNERLQETSFKHEFDRLLRL
jgi:hypothetical protein